MSEWPVWFDLSGTGTPQLTAWTNPKTEEGILYFDHNRNGVIDGGHELFGDVTLLPDGTRPRHGFDALAAYDRPENGGNGDGAISPGDTVWGKLRVWVDRNHDGLMTQDENYSLGELGILSISLSYSTMTAAEDFGIDPSGNLHLLQGTFVRLLRGSGPPRLVTRSVHDVLFRR